MRIRISSRALRFLAPALCVLVPAWAGALRPYALEAEARVNPVGIGTGLPRLSWKLQSTQNGDRQTAYRIRAASSLDSLAAGNSDLWDSARVASADTAWIEYAGKPLVSFQHCWWAVRVWDVSGSASEWSAPAEWTVAILDSREWKGNWISTDSNRLTSGPMPLFRKDFRLDRSLRRALVMVAGLGFHEVRINGSKVGNHVLAPAWTNFHESVTYETFDVTSLLHRGPNALGVLLGNGFYNVPGGRYAKFTSSFGAPRLRLHLHLEFSDGTAADEGTDSTWRVHDGPITFSCIYGGEDYDARLDLPGWDQAGFDDSSWPHASFIEAPGGVLRAQASPAVIVQEVFHPVRVTQPKPGVYIYDLGQNFAGWPRITVNGRAGSQVRLTPGELLDHDGLVTQKSSGGPVYFSYTLRGGSTEQWAPRFSYYGFRYVQVEGAVLQDLEGQFLYLDTPCVGHFSSSSNLFNSIHALIDAAVRSNLQHVLTDCPHREKLGWLEEAYLMGPSLLYNWDLRTFYAKEVQDIIEAQRPNGLIPDIAPEYTVFGGAFRDSPEWGSAGILIPWLSWQWYGNIQALQDAYPMMKAYSAYLGTEAKRGLLTHGLGDWYDIGPGSPGPSKLTPSGVTASATWWRDLRVLQQSAKLLGHPGDEALFADQSSHLGHDFQEAFYHSEQPSYANGSQTSLAMPLAMGLAPEAARVGLSQALVDKVHAAADHTTAGDIGYHYVLNALLLTGRSDVIFQLANQKNTPSYAAQLAAGATSLTEAWDANPESSQNHLMLGHIDEWFYAGLGGISPDFDTPQLRHIRIQPEPVGDVTQVKTSWDSFRGPVAVRWRIENGAFHLSVGIPPGIQATILLPAQMPGGSRAIHEVGSGEYEYTVSNFRR